MSSVKRVLLFAVILPATLGGCGLAVPEKNPLAPDTLDRNDLSSGGKYEDKLVRHIFCEIAVGLWKAYEHVKAQDQPKIPGPPESMKLPWLKDWGTAITLAITVEDQSGLSPGLSLTTPFANKVFTFPTGGNVTSPQSFSFGIGGSATANATRSETIQFTYTNVGLLKAAKYFLSEQPNFDDACKFSQTGVTIDSDLKIWEFVYDKAVIAANGNASSYVPKIVAVKNPDGTVKMAPVKNPDGTVVKKPDGTVEMAPVLKPEKDKDGNDVYTQHPSWPLYNEFTENITFTTIFGGNVTPTWKLARVSANSSGNLLSATRTNTNQLTITLGPIKTPASPTAPTQLKQGAQTQHDNTVLSNQIKSP
ncbi:MAG: hypothetical protein WCF20_12520 [Methylovirgula sp.]